MWFHCTFLHQWTCVYLCLLGIHFWFPILSVSTASDKHWGEKPGVGTRSHTELAARVRQLRSIPDYTGLREYNIYGRVQLRLPELLTSKPTLFMSVKLARNHRGCGNLVYTSCWNLEPVDNNTCTQIRWSTKPIVESWTYRNGGAQRGDWYFPPGSPRVLLVVKRL